MTLGHPVGPESVTFTDRAGCADLHLTDTCLLKHPGIDGFQVHQVFFPLGADEGLHGLAIGFPQGLGNIGMGFKMAEADVGAYGGPDILRRLP